MCKFNLLLPRVTKAPACLCQKILTKYGIGQLDLSYEFETMQEIENIIKGDKFKEKLNKNEAIDPEEFLQESSVEDPGRNDMQSLYLTEPLFANAEQNTRNISIMNGANKVKVDKRHTIETELSKNIRPKSENATAAPIYVDIRTKKHVVDSTFDTAPHNLSVDYCTSDFIRQAGQTLLNRAKRNRSALKAVLKGNSKK